jgi:long-chain fatty acid transport protein
MRFTVKHAVFATACVAAFPAQATNGYFLPGFGIRAEGMGGVGIAYGTDTLSTAANPANAVKIGKRGDIGFAIFNPERHASVGTDAGGASPFGFHGDVESDAKYFIMPEMGFSMPVSDKLHFSLAVVGNGGMNTTYPENFFSFMDSQPPRDEKVGVDMMQLLVPITAAYKVNDSHALGVSLVLAETRFRAYGLQAFQVFDKGFTITADPDHLTNKGYDYSYGAGVKVGWLGDFLDDRLSVGLSYASRSYMTEFDEYAGLFAEQGDFDIPENYGIGIAIKPVRNLVLAADVTRINYSDIASVGNPGMSTPIGPGGVPSIPDSSKELGNDDGMGFGWEDQTVYKVGVQYGMNNRLQLRAGYNYGKSPIPDNMVTFNLLAPATVEKHYSVGFSYLANDNLEVSGTYMYAASHSQSACGQNIVNCASFNMHQNVFGITFGWLLDPATTTVAGYGDGDWAGIDFDGLYAGFSFGQSRYRDIAADSANTRSEGWKAYLGYEFNRYFALEGGYVNLNDMTAVAGVMNTNIATDAWALGAVARLPVTERMSVFGKVGTAYMLADIKEKNVATGEFRRSGDDDFEPNYGAGVSYAVLDNIDVRAEWERFERKDLDIDLMTAGVALKF